MGRRKKYKPNELKEAIEAYFDEISASELLFEVVPMYKRDKQGNEVPDTDSWGHQKFCRVPVMAGNGKQAKRIRWLIQPKITDLCAFLKISPTTWGEYCKDERFVESTTRAQGRVESYLQEQLLTKNGSRGAKFALQHNFGWKEKKEIGLDEKTAAGLQQHAEHLTMAQKMDVLRETCEEFEELMKEEA